MLDILLKIIERSSIFNEKAKLESLTNNHLISLESQSQKSYICLPINNIEVQKGNLDAPFQFPISSNDSGEVQDEDREDDKEEAKSL